MLKISLLTALALIAFAANSVLCRLALGEDLIDAGTFTSVRLLSGAFVLLLFVKIQHKTTNDTNSGSWFASVMLFVYAAAFSYAYISLDTGTGALILFGAVQITMVLWVMFSGGRLKPLEWVGLFLAFVGFVYLMLPSASTPSLLGFVFMVVAGIAWGFYSIQGQSSKQPLLDTATNFKRTIPMVLVLLLLSIRGASYTNEGLVFAVLSGAIASGAGYTIWYMALAGLQTTQAAVLQLLVPVIAAMGGVLFVSESVTVRLLISAGLILGGILLVLLGKQKNKSSTKA